MPAGGFITPINPEGPNVVGPFIVPLVLQPATPSGGGGDGVSRVWNEDPANYLDTLDRTTQSGLSTQIAWIKPDSLGDHHTIFGNMFDAGYAMRISATNQLELIWANGLNQFTASKPLLIADGAAIDYLVVGQPVFVAINVITSNPPLLEFFAGLTPQTVVSLGTESGSGTINNNGIQIVGIGVNKFGSTPQNAFHGAMQRVARWAQVNLSLAELQAVAVCGAEIPQAAACYFFYEMTGDDPEPDSSISASHADVVGNLPTSTDICVGDGTPGGGGGGGGFVCSKLTVGISIGVGMGMS